MSNVVPYRVGAVATLLALSLTGCVVAPARPYSMPRSAPEAVAPPPREVVFYPRAGQSEGQQDRDRYECHQWAVRQSGFDPSLPQAVGSPSVRVVPAGAPGHDTAALAVTGALVGAAVARPHRGAEGALVGATIGAVAGAMSDTARAEQAQRMEQAYAAQEQRQQAMLEQQADAYRRAISACLEARGYTVR